MKSLLAALCICATSALAASPELQSMIGNAEAVAAMQPKSAVLPHGNIHVTTTPGIARTYDEQGRWLELNTPKGNVYLRYKGADEWPSEFSRNGVVWWPLTYDSADQQARFQSLVSQMVGHGKSKSSPLDRYDEDLKYRAVDDVLGESRSMDAPTLTPVYQQSGTDQPASWWDQIVAWWNKPACKSTCDATNNWAQVGCALIATAFMDPWVGAGCSIAETAIWQWCTATGSEC